MKRRELKRFIAFAMAVVMVVSLIAFDNRFGTDAESDKSVTLKVDELLSDASDYDTGSDGTVDMDSVDRIIKAYKDSTDVTFSGSDYYILEEPDGVKAEITATDSDAAATANGLVPAAEAEKITIDKNNEEYEVGVYYFQDDKFTFAGIISLMFDDVKPDLEVSNTTASTGYITLDDGTVVMKNGGSLSYSVKASDSESGIAKVTYSLGSQSEKEVTGGSVNLTQAGTYVFHAYDNAGNSKDSDKIAVAIATRPVVTEVAASEGATITSVGGSHYIYGENKVDITVSAKELTTGNTNITADVNLKLNYVITTTSLSNPDDVLDSIGSVSFTDGKATISTPASTEGKSVKLVMQVTDTFGSSTYAFDENGAIVFIDDDPPEINISKVSLSADREFDYAGYAAYTEKWTQSATLALDVTEDASYIKEVYYTTDYKGAGNPVTTDLTTNAGAYSYSNNIVINKDENGDGKYVTTIYATNYLGQLQTFGSFNVWIDTTAPTVSVISSTQKKNVAGADDYVVSGTEGETLTVKAADTDGSGVSDITMKISKDGETAQEVTLTDNAYTVTEAGSYKAYVVVTDKAGNKTTCDTVSFTIDNIPISTTFKATAHTSDGDAELEAGITKASDQFTGAKNGIDIAYTATGYMLDADDVAITATKDGKNIDCQVEVAPSDSGEDCNTVTITYTVPYDSKGSTQGEYVFSFVASKHYDKDTKTEADGTAFTYDITAPEVTFVGFKNTTGVADGIYFYDADTVPTIEIISKDNYSVLGYNVKANDGTSLSSGNAGENGESKLITLDGAKANTIYTITVYVSDKAGNVGKAVATRRFAIDSVRPTASVANVSSSGSLSPYWNNSNVTLKASGTDNMYVYSFKAAATCDGVRLDDQQVRVSAPGKKASAEFTYTDEGEYVVNVYAIDAAGNSSLAYTSKFVIDKSSPLLEVTGIPSNGLSKGTTVGLKVTDKYGVRSGDISITEYYESYDKTISGNKAVTLNGSAKSLSANVSCRQISGKACHYWFVISGKDSSGNPLKDSSGKTSIRVDLYVDNTAPSIVVTPVPASTNDGYYNTAVSFDVAVTEQFDVTSLGYTHVVSVSNNNSIAGDTGAEDIFSTTNSKMTVTKSAQGIYDLEITAVDAFGNEKTYPVKFVIDKTKPTVALGSVDTTSNTNVSLPITVTDNYNGSKYTIHVSKKSASGAVSSYDIAGVWEGTRDTFNETFQEEGDYTVTVTVEDKAGNTATSSASTFRIDKTAPVLSISGVNDAQSNSCTATMSINEAFPLTSGGGDNADVSVTITKKADGTGESTIATMSYSNFSGSNPHTASYTFDEDGEYTITFSATDSCGNTASTLTKTFKVDKTAPVISMSVVDKDNKSVSAYDTIGSDDDSDKNHVVMGINIEETFYSSNNVVFTVKKDGKDVSNEYFAGYSNRSSVSSVQQTFDEDGVYEVTVSAEDALGNKAEEQSITFTVDNTPPELADTDIMTEFKGRASTSDEIVLNAEDFQKLKDGGYDKLWYVNDTSIFNVDVKLDGVTFVDFSDLEDGYHVMTITVTDAVNHVSTDTFEFTYDGTAPRIIISGVEDGETVKEPFTLGISLEDADDQITKISINGKEIDPSEYESTNSYEMNVTEYDKYEILVEATDLAGNTASTYDEENEAYFTFTLAEKISPLMLIIIIIVILLLLALLIYFVIRNRKKEK